jgi:hypothetical protein
MLRQRLKDPKVQLRFGYILLILASASRFAFERTTDFSAGFADGATGMLYGMSIGFLLWGIRTTARRRSTVDGCSR